MVRPAHTPDAALPTPGPTPGPTTGLEARPLARLALADGTVFAGRAFGAVGRAIVSCAEVVFNTAMCGYQESLTDPSYTGQILVQTFPLIGNTGVNAADEESRRVQVAGLVVRELARRHSNFRAEESLDAYLARHGVLGIEGVDTRALTSRLRQGGSTQGVLTDLPRVGQGALSDDRLAAMAREAPSMDGQNLVPRVGCRGAERWTESLGSWAARRDVHSGGASLRVLAIDCGAKRNILRNLADRGCDVLVIPHDTPAADIARRFDAMEADGVFISNGPGDPAAVEGLIATLRELIRRDQPAIPMFGICLGHQLLALALGATTYKLKFGHRGANQPVRNDERGVVEITSQNHGFAVDPASLLAAGGVPTHRHLNDGTLAGFRVKDRPVFCVQYHPEASPGPHDAGYLFDQFVDAMRKSRRLRASASNAVR